jgi:hypothetical protein
MIVDIKPCYIHSSLWGTAESRFEGYDLGDFDKYSLIYQNRKLSEIISIDEIAEDFQSKMNYHSLYLIEQTNLYLEFAVFNRRITFSEFLEFREKISKDFTDRDELYCRCIDVLRKAKYN